jgi:hypothetical protein
MTLLHLIIYHLVNFRLPNRKHAIKTLLHEKSFYVDSSWTKNYKTSSSGASSSVQLKRIPSIGIAEK